MVTSVIACQGTLHSKLKHPEVEGHRVLMPSAPLPRSLTHLPPGLETVPLSRTGPKMARLSSIVVQFQRRPRN